MLENDLGQEFAQSRRVPSATNGMGFRRQTGVNQAEATLDNTTNVGTRGRTFTFIANTTSQVALAGNPRRVGFAIQNNGSDDIFICVGSYMGRTATAVLGGIKLAATGYFEMMQNYCPQNDIIIVSLTGDTECVIMEVAK